MTSEARKIYDLAIRTFGEDHQERRVLEEMSELSIEILKKERGRRDRVAMASEVADVLNTIDQLIIINNIPHLVQEMRIKKLRKLEDEIHDEIRKREMGVDAYGQG